MKTKAGTALLSRIIPDNDKFRITTREDLGPLAASIKRSGLLNPPILASTDNSHYIIICGFRRVAACRRLGWDRVDARFVSPGTSAKACAVAAIADNCTQRELNLFEQARAVKLLTNTLPEGADIVQVAGQVGLPMAASVLARIRSLCDLPLKLQQGIIEATLSLPMADRLGRMDGEDALEAYGLFCDIRAGLNVQRELLDYAEESARREGVKLVDILKSAPVMEIRSSDELDRAGKRGRIRKLLKVRRYPALAEAEAKFQKRSFALGLSPEMKLLPPAGFEGPNYVLSLKFSSLEQLREQKNTIGQMLNGDALKKILD